MREKFEKWAAEAGHRNFTKISEDDPDYVRSDIQELWECWQDAWEMALEVTQ
jgi:hypothetical protein